MFYSEKDHKIFFTLFENRHILNSVKKFLYYKEGNFLTQQVGSSILLTFHRRNDTLILNYIVKLFYVQNNYNLVFICSFLTRGGGFRSLKIGLCMNASRIFTTARMLPFKLRLGAPNFVFRAFGAEVLSLWCFLKKAQIGTSISSSYI